MSNASITKYYPYKPKKWAILLSFIFCGLTSWFFAEMALENDRGLTLALFRHVVEFSFSPSEATLFYWSLSVFCGAMLLFCFFGLYRVFDSKAQIILTNKEISVPLSLYKLNKTITIPFNEILSMEIHEIHCIRFLKIIHQTGKTQVNESFLPKKSMLDEIFDSLSSKSDANR